MKRMLPRGPYMTSAMLPRREISSQRSSGVPAASRGMRNLLLSIQLYQSKILKALLLLSSGFLKKLPARLLLFPCAAAEDCNREQRREEERKRERPPQAGVRQWSEVCEHVSERESDDPEKNERYCH